MPTLVLNAYSKAYATITNRIKATVYLQTDPQAAIASIIDTTAGHPARIWSFPGLPRNNYGFSLDEIDAGGLVVNNLADFDVVPGELDGFLVRDDEQPQVDVTTGFVSGTNTFTFDGTGGKPDYTGWEIVPSELNGRGILVRGVDYSWDKTTGIFLLLISGDVFSNGTYYNIHFEPITQPAGNSYPTVTDFEIVLVDSDTTLDDTYFGKKLIVEPTGVYVELKLPDINTIPQGRRLMIETGDGIHCTKVIPNGSDAINWLRGNIYIAGNERLSIYAYSRLGVKEWRVDECDGNFKTVGQSVNDDAVVADVFNRLVSNGASILKTQYARLYNEFVLQLDASQVVDYDSWATGNNKYLFSKANSANPAYANQFHIPDRRNLYQRNNSTGKAGDFQDEMVKATGTSITLPLVQHTASAGTFGITDGPLASPATYTVPCTFGTGTETRPKTYLINNYILF